MTFRVEPATMEHFETIKDDIRMADLMEWQAFSGNRLADTLAETIDVCGTYEPCLVAVHEETGLPVCFWGVNLSAANEPGIVWLFGTNFGMTQVRPLHRILHKEVDKLHQVAGPLVAYCDVRNEAHHLWIRRLGFEAQGVFENALGFTFIEYRKED